MQGAGGGNGGGESHAAATYRTMRSRHAGAVMGDINITPEDRPVTVIVNARGTVYINDKPVALPLLEDQLRGRLQGMVTKVVYLRADEALRYGKVIEVVDIMKHAGVEQIGFAYDLPPDKTAR